jgi:hypothetical protein
MSALRPGSIVRGRFAMNDVALFVAFQVSKTLNHPLQPAIRDVATVQPLNAAMLLKNERSPSQLIFRVAI